MFATTSHIMLAVAVRYAQGLLYSAENEADRTEEYLLLKRMIVREFVIGDRSPARTKRNRHQSGGAKPAVYRKDETHE